MLQSIHSRILQMTITASKSGHFTLLRILDHYICISPFQRRIEIESEAMLSMLGQKQLKMLLTIWIRLCCPLVCKHEIQTQ